MGGYQTIKGKDEFYERLKEDYLERFRRGRRESFWNNIPLTRIEWFPNSRNEGLYGYTYRQSGKIALNEKLKEEPEEKEDTDMHESGHTEWEYETRRKTEERREILFPKKKDYEVGLVPEYRV